MAFKEKVSLTEARVQARTLMLEYLRRPSHERGLEYYEYAKCWAPISKERHETIERLLENAKLNGSQYGDKDDFALWRELNRIWASYARQLSPGQREYFHKKLDEAETIEDRWQFSKEAVLTCIGDAEAISPDIEGAEYYGDFANIVGGYARQGNFSGNEEAWFFVWYVGYENHRRKLGLKKAKRP